MACHVRHRCAVVAFGVWAASGAAVAQDTPSSGLEAIETIVVVDTTSILKFISNRFGLEMLPGIRDNVGDLSHAFDFETP